MNGRFLFKLSDSQVWCAAEMPAMADRMKNSETMATIACRTLGFLDRTASRGGAKGPHHVCYWGQLGSEYFA
jgi:hypothetical protein